ALHLEALENRITPSVLTVTNTMDSGAGSLRAAIQNAHNGSLIRFAPSLAGSTITLTSGELSINHNVNIVGLGMNRLTIDADNISRIFDITGASNVQISGLTLANGFAGASSPHPGEGGGIFDDSGHLMLRNVELKNDVAAGANGALGQNGGDGLGGGIFF